MISNVFNGCIIKLHEVQKVAFCNLGFLASSLVSFLIPENYFFTFPGL